MTDYIAPLSWHIRWAAYEVATAYDGVEHLDCPYGDLLINEWAALAGDPATAGQTERVAGVFRALRLFARRAHNPKPNRS